MADEQKPSAADIAGYKQWLEKNPNDPMAPKLRQKLQSMGELQADAPKEAPSPSDELLRSVGVPEPAISVFDFPRDLSGGLARGLARASTGAGQLLQDVGIPGFTDPDTERFANAPAKNFPERAGRFIGSAVPGMMIGNPFLGGLVTGAVQPTESGDLKSHAINAGVGGVTGYAGGRLLGAGAATPDNVTSSWWRSVMRIIDRENLTPNRLGSEASAAVRRHVGDALNDIRSQMNLPFRRLPDLDAARNAISNNMYGPFQQRFGDLYHTYVYTPLADALARGIPMSGRTLADYVSGITDAAQEIYRAAVQNPNADSAGMFQVARGMRDMVRTIEHYASEANPSLRPLLTEAKRAYNLWSIGDAVATAGRGGAASAKQFLDAWTKRLGSSTANLGNLTGANAALRDWLEQANKMEPAVRHGWMGRGAAAIPAILTALGAKKLGVDWPFDLMAGAGAAAAFDPSGIASILARVPAIARSFPSLMASGTTQVADDPLVSKTASNFWKALTAPSGPMQ